MAEAPEEEQQAQAEQADQAEQNEAEQQGDDDLNLDTDASRGQKIKKIIKIVVLVILFIAGGASYILIKMSQEEPTIRQLTPISADGTVLDPDEMTEAAPTKVEEVKKKGKANYYNITPSFIINVLSQDDKRHYIQFDVSIMTRDSSLFYKLEHHDPVIKSIVLTVASSQSYEMLTTLQGREKFRDELLGELQIKLEELTGSKGVEEVLFTKFIME